MQVICIIHWTNPGSNMQIAVMECWLVCHFACTIDSAELEQDLAPLSGMLPAPMVLHEVRRFGFCAQFMQCNFGGNSQLLLRVFRGVCLHIWLGQEFL